MPRKAKRKSNLGGARPGSGQKCKGDSPRVHTVSPRFTADEYALLRDAANSGGVSLSDYIRIHVLARACEVTLARFRTGWWATYPDGRTGYGETPEKAAETAMFSRSSAKVAKSD
jgi:hypothetical protein